MNTPEEQDVLVQWARAKPLVGKLFIFGSRARGDHRPDSDIDIAIELDMSADVGVDDSGGLATWMFEADGWEKELASLLPYKVDLEWFRGHDTPTIQNGIDQSSILVYQKAR